MEDERGVEASGTMCFHGVEYYVHVWVQSDELHVQVEEQSVKGGADSDRWGAHFPALYIEELTKKTGNFKRFFTFVNMLMSALQHKSESVFIDLLTYSDLELYRKRKLGKSTGTPSNAPDPVTSLQNKRYMILTYAVEFDRVHYPLPLNYVDSPSPDMLQRTIRRLKQTLMEARSTSDGAMEKRLESIRDENASLRLRIQQLQEAHDRQDDATSVVHLKSELIAATAENKELSTMYEQLRKESSKEIQGLQAQVDLLRSQPPPQHNVADESQYIQRIRHLERDVERATEDHASRVKELHEQLKDATNELNATKTTVQELQLKNRELLRQLAIQRTKSNQSKSSVARSNNATATSTPSQNGSTKPRRPSSAAASSDSEGGNPFDRKQDKAKFKRFDPTAYHHERQLKLRARSQSPHTPTRKPPSGYSSDSSAGYQSGGSTSTRRSRLPRNSSSQRETDTRLSSPRVFNSVGKQQNVRDYPHTTAATRSPRQSTAKKTITTTHPVQGTRHTSPRGRPKPSKKALHRLPLDDSDDSDKDRLPLQSFVDIDNRLNALQQFLKDAKQSKKHY
ncbi:hypothetical protein H310_06865 [Aphanomyces invadans]|uniref:Coiled-coil domain-containing protein 61 n=1 Tax=Aphanomyces invadans TaxID=157072 RepID=A0A024U4Y3_9STRA|nr:hypothetical protein H310_06865 [Aphanomyces invadans]ETW01300.1 hypothetical protein H310_06865 [Aphanomyces invadans]|eukprot:XP_008870298.1 hypothetical protein H310_06865 [Aphanomyces invadans]